MMYKQILEELKRIIDKITLFFVRLPYYKICRDIEETIISLIDKSEGRLESIKADRTTKFNEKWVKHLFNIYDKPSEYPESVKEKLDRYSSGQNWELAWAKATFELIGLSKIENSVEKLKDIIEETHIWYSIEAMKVLVKYPDFFDEVENIEFTEMAFEKKGKFGPYGHIYMKYLSALKDKPLVTSLLSRLTTRSIVKDNNWAYLQSFYFVKDLYEQGNPLLEKYCYYFLDVAISEQRIKEGKYSRRFKFTKPLKARSLKTYLKIKPNDAFAIEVLENWKKKETDEEILDILN